MARGFLIRKLLGNRSNPCAATGIHHHHHHHHHHRKICSDSIETLAPTSILSDSSPHSHTVNIPKLPFSSSSSSSSYNPYSNLQFLQHQRHLSQAAAAAAAPAPDIFPSVPPNMVFIRTKSEHMSAVKQVEDGLLPAVFFFTYYMSGYTTKELSPTIRMLREKYPHVTIYKTIILEASIAELCVEMRVLLPMPTFHLYVNGRMVEEICGPMDGDLIETRDTFLKTLIDAFEELYRYVIPVKTTKPRSSSEMLRRTQQFVIQAKKDENCKGVPTSASGILGEGTQHVTKAVKDEDGTRVVGGRKLVGAATLSQERGAATLAQKSGALVEAVERSDVPSLHQVMQVVDSMYNGCPRDQLWWFAKGLFKAEPEKRVIFSMLEGSWGKMYWLYGQLAEE